MAQDRDRRSNGDDPHARPDADRDKSINLSPDDVAFLHAERDRRRKRDEDCREVRNNVISSVIAGVVVAIVLGAGGTLIWLFRHTIVTALAGHLKP